jgi:hypothetical protein
MFQGEGMINIKISAIVSGGAFILSLVIGLLSGVGIFALVRALILGAVFFLITGGTYWLVVKFLPELLSPLPEQPDPEAKTEPGAQVDISLGEEEPQAAFREIPEGSGPLPEENAGMDQFDNIGYTQAGKVEEGLSAEEPFMEASMESLSGERPPLPSSRGKPAVPEDDFDSVDELPDMDSLASVFASSDGSDNGELARVLPLDISQKKEGSRPGTGKLDQDYSTNDMAAAIQTILKRD